MTKEQNEVSTIEEKIRDLIVVCCSHTTHSTFSEEYTCKVNQIISIVRTDERKAERERIREGIEKNIHWQHQPSTGEFPPKARKVIYLDDIEKLLRPESDTEK